MDIPADKDLIELLVLGVHEVSEAYPNTKYRLQSLENSEKLLISKIHSSGWKRNFSKKSSVVSRLAKIVRFGLANLLVLLRFHIRNKKQLVYITYPSIILSFYLGTFTRQRYVIDAFISIYDTAVIDRKLLKKDSFLAKLLFAVERQSFLKAKKVIVDTIANADYLAELYNISRNKFIAIPLSTNENEFSPQAYSPSLEICKIIFIGTLVPLHGISVIAQAIEILSNVSDIHFEIIGDGQDRCILQSFMRKKPENVTWISVWQPSESIASIIGTADICLGIFGTTDKTKRVLPYKLYAYSRIGRPIINAGLRPTENNDAPPWHTIEPGDAQKLAEAIVTLKNNPHLRQNLADNSRNYYSNNLSNQRALACLLKIFEQLSIA